MRTRRGGIPGALLLAGALLAGSAAAEEGRSLVDDAGRTVRLPARIDRVFAAGPPAATLVFVVAPEKLIGWPLPLRIKAKDYLPGEYAALPEVGHLAGRGSSSGPEAVAALRPDLILDTGEMSSTYVSMAERVQQQTGIAYALINGRFDQSPALLRRVGTLLDRPERGEETARFAQAVMSRVADKVGSIPTPERKRVYYARGPNGLETGFKGSINTEVIEFAGGRNVAEGGESTGVGNVSLEQLMIWDPDVIIAESAAFVETELRLGGWQRLRAVREHRVYRAPDVPFGWIDGPPSVNRVVGAAWLASVLYPDRVEGDLANTVGAFYRLFYGVELDERQMGRLLAIGAAR